ncbi:MAG: Hsp33 family molecular chaperone HslO [Woeseiaceae bacterium]
MTTKLTPSFDQLNRYLFTHKHVRGELVQLTHSYQTIIAEHNYPQGVSELMGELLAATCLLTARLKFDGEIAVQLQGDGPVSYLVINGNNDQQMRGIAKLNKATDAVGLNNLLGKGTMVITIQPKEGKAYQGVVALDKTSITECLCQYFEVSEQIPTKLWLFVDTEKQQAGGSLIQLLPDGGDKNQQLDDFDHLCQLTNTIKAVEVFTLPANEVLYRLYHQEEVQLFEPQSVSFCCTCSAEKCFSTIAQMEPSEIESILHEQGKITMTCDYCKTSYFFDQQKLAGLLKKQ